MLTLHTLDNEYDGSERDYHQFVQRGHQHLLDSQALCSNQTLRSFLISDIIEAGDVNFKQLKSMHLALEDGDIHKLLQLAQQFHNQGEAKANCMTHFGEWSFDSKVLETPTLRELQLDVWAQHPVCSRWEWKQAVASESTNLGYWEYIEHLLEQQEHDA